MLSSLPSVAAPGERADHCPACGGTSLRARFPKALPWVAECGGCGLVFASPQPSDAELGRIYDEHYYEQFGFVEGVASDNNAGIEQLKRATYDAMLSFAEQSVSTHNRRLIDIGCGLGFSLLAATARGWQAEGLDPLGQERPGRLIRRGTLEDYSPNERYGVVSMIDVIEHVRDPRAQIEKAASLLDDGGVLMLATNDISSRGGRMLGSRWTHLHRAHLWFFTPETLSLFVESAGLDVVAIAPAERVYNLQYIASILARGGNFRLAQLAARAALAWVPRDLRVKAWPAMREGFVLLAKPRRSTPTP